MLNGKCILITGGTGSFGKKFVETVLSRYNPKKLIVFSRDELKQYEMQQIYGNGRVRYFLGDIRNRDRLHRAFSGVDVIVHAAALKQVPACEYNPFEAVNTNILGAENIINAAIDNNVEKVIALSTDKAVSPVNLYGATKLCAEKLFLAGNNYVGEKRQTRFSNVRYGNVVGSRGSVIPFFLKIKDTGKVPITDPRMTRFWITLEQAVEFVLSSLEMMEGGETFIPKIPTMNIMDLAEAIAPECEKKVIGIRAGEKLHEELITSDESRDTIELNDRYIILSDHLRSEKSYLGQTTPVPEEFSYSSNSKFHELTIDELKQMINHLEKRKVYALKMDKVPIDA